MRLDYGRPAPAKNRGAFARQLCKAKSGVYRCRFAQDRQTNTADAHPARIAISEQRHHGRRRPHALRCARRVGSRIRATCGRAIAAATMREAKSPFPAAGSIGDMHMRSAGRRCVIGRDPARPAAQHRIDAGRIALQIDGVAGRVMAVPAAGAEARDDAASARRHDLTRLGSKRPDHAGKAHRAAARCTVSGATRITRAIGITATLDDADALHAARILVAANVFDAANVFVAASMTITRDVRRVPIGSSARGEFLSRRGGRRNMLRGGCGRNVPRGGAGWRIGEKNRKANSGEYATKDRFVHYVNHVGFVIGSKRSGRPDRAGRG